MALKREAGYKLKEKPNISAKKVSELAQSVEKFRLLAHAMEFGIFDHLENEKTLSEIVEEMKLNRRIANKYCDYLVALGFLVKNKDKYGLTKTSRCYLVKKSEYYIGNYITFYKTWRTEGEYGYTQALKNGSGESNEALWTFDETGWLALAEGASIGDIQDNLRKLEGSLDLAKVKKMLDLGGGHGLFAIALTDKYPQAEAIVFDYPDMIKNAAEPNIQKFGHGKLGTKAGDMVKDDFGEGYDLIHAANSLYLPEEQLITTLKKIYTSLTTGGYLSVKLCLRGGNIKTSSKGALLFDLSTAISKKDDVVYNRKSFLKLLENNGFTIIKVYNNKELEGTSNLIVAKKK